MVTQWLFHEYRRRVLSLLLLHPKANYHVREIARLTDTVPGSLHRELAKLAKAEVLIRDVQKGQVFYQANQNFIIFDELVSILKKTSGIIEVLFEAFSPIAEKIEIALVYGSIASKSENASSDIDVLIIGQLNFTETVRILYPIQKILSREINPKIYTHNEWKKLAIQQSGFIQEILQKPKLFIIGNENDFKQFSREKS